MVPDLNKISDLERLKRLFDSFSEATGIAVSIVSPEGEACSDVGNQKLCSDFFLKDPESASACLQNEVRIQAQLMHTEAPIIHHCPHGLCIGATPIVINDRHVANLFTGGFLFEPPDPETTVTFKRRAKELDVDEHDFTGALMDIPIISADRVKRLLQYLKQMGEMSLQHLKLRENVDSMLEARASLAKKLKQCEAESRRLARILDDNPIPTFVIDSDAKIIHWNRACEMLTGAPSAKMIGTDKHKQAYYPYRRPLLADLIVKKSSPDEFCKQYGGDFKESLLVEGGYEGEAFFPSMGESGKWLFFTAAPIKDADRNVIGAIETIQDITERHETERNLRVSEARYRQLFDAANDGIFVLKDNILVDCNQKGQDLFNASREEIVGKSPMAFSPDTQPDGRASKEEIQKNEELVRQGVRQVFDWHFIRKDGASFDAEVSLTQFTVGEAPHTLAIVRDITERKKMILSLQEREKELDEKSRYLEKVNQALKASLDHREIEKRAVEENMLVNLKRFIFPYIEALDNCSVNTDARAYLNIIKTNLNDLVSRFSRTIFWQYLDLTPTEVHIADLIRIGKNSKAIAHMLGLSPSSVQWHRKNIREKLGLTNKKVNLQTYLTSLSE